MTIVQLQEWLREQPDGARAGKKMLTQYARTPHLIRDVQLQLEAVHCAMQDELQVTTMTSSFTDGMEQLI